MLISYPVYRGASSVMFFIPVQPTNITIEKIIWIQELLPYRNPKGPGLRLEEFPFPTGDLIVTDLAHL
jgi:hypothetical protein